MKIGAMSRRESSSQLRRLYRRNRVNSLYHAFAKHGRCGPTAGSQVRVVKTMPHNVADDAPGKPRSGFPGPCRSACHAGRPRNFNPMGRSSWVAPDSSRDSRLLGARTDAMTPTLLRELELWWAVVHGALPNCQSLVTAIGCVEMRRSMVIEIHPNDDSVEPIELRHLRSAPVRPASRPRSTCR